MPIHDRRPKSNGAILVLTKRFAAKTMMRCVYLFVVIGNIEYLFVLNFLKTCVSKQK